MAGTLRALRSSASVVAVMWAWIFGGIALAGLVMLVMYGVWLWHKASDLWFELQRLGTQAAELGDLVQQLELDKLEHPHRA